MRIAVAAGLGLIGGFFVGLLLSQVIGMAGLLLFDQAVGIKFLPIYTAVAGTLIVPVWAIRIRRRSE